jgi:hypothetical protein
MNYQVVEQEIKSKVNSLGIECKNLQRYLLKDKIDPCTVSHLEKRKSENGIKNT